MSTTGRKADKEYVVFDEFHWLSPDHIEYIYRGWEYALANYSFLKQSYPNECLGLTTREDYMKLSKERLAELLAERDAYPSGNIPVLNDPRPLCGYGGYCTNKFRDCVGCPGVHYPTGTRTVTSVSNTALKQE